MVIQGHIRNGVVVLEGNPLLPEGAAVTVTYTEPAFTPPAERKRVQFPLVHSEHPGTLQLTNERIAEILDEEEVAAFLSLNRSAAPKTPRGDPG